MDKPVKLERMHWRRTAYIGLLLSAVGCSVSSPRYYVIRDGETVRDIAQKFRLSESDLLKRNSKISWRAGSKVYIPFERLDRPLASFSKSGRAHSGKLLKTLPELDPSSRKQMEHFGLKWPLKNPVVSSDFGVRGYRFHEGIDLSAKRETPVFASGDGIVVYSSDRISGYGRMIIIDHGQRIRTVYAHLQKMKVNKGMHVKKGQQIGLVGSSGKATGPHLHFEVRSGAKPHNPMYYLPPRLDTRIAKSR